MFTKDAVLHHGMKVMSNPRVLKLIQDERLMKTMMSAMEAAGRFTGAMQEHTERLAHLLSFATEQDVRDLRRTVRSLEDQIAELKHQLDELKSVGTNNDVETR